MPEKKTKLISVHRSNLIEDHRELVRNCKFSVIDERCMKIAEIDPDKIGVIAAQPGDIGKTYEEKLAELKQSGYILPDLSIARALQSNPESIPEHWKRLINDLYTPKVFFMGTVIRTDLPDGRRFVNMGYSAGRPYMFVKDADCKVDEYSWFAVVRP